MKKIKTKVILLSPGTLKVNASCKNLRIFLKLSKSFRSFLCFLWILNIHIKKIADTLSPTGMLQNVNISINHYNMYTNWPHNLVTLQSTRYLISISLINTVQRYGHLNTHNEPGASTIFSSRPTNGLLNRPRRRCRWKGTKLSFCWSLATPMFRIKATYNRLVNGTWRKRRILANNKSSYNLTEVRTLGTAISIAHKRTKTNIKIGPTQKALQL